MRPPSAVLVAAAIFGVLLSGTAESTVQQASRCAALEKAVEAARAEFQAKTRAVFALEDKITIQEELIRAQEAVLKLSAAAEQQAKNQWQAAIDRLNACFSKPRNNACEAETRAMQDATDRLNARRKVRLNDEGRVKASREALADLQKACADARDAWYEALKALQKAQAALAGCKRMA
jgi:hypothetical protein